MAVLGCGVIANEMAVALQKNGKNIYAVGNRTHEKAAAFAEKYGIGKVYDDFHEMFTDPEVDVIYITTPHNTHLGFMKEAIANGKHILVEKSITLNSDELDEAIALAKEKGVIIGEAMTIYHMPIYKELKKILDSGRLGRVNLITMNFGSFKEYNMKNRFFNRNLAGGAMLDIGVYALSFLRWFFDSKPDQLLSQVKPAPTGVDEQAGLLLTNQEGQMASVMLSLHSKQPKRGMVPVRTDLSRSWSTRVPGKQKSQTLPLANPKSSKPVTTPMHSPMSSRHGTRHQWRCICHAPRLHEGRHGSDDLLPQNLGLYVPGGRKIRFAHQKPLPGTHQMPGRGTSFHL